jgi:16S rRNA (guanine527-N7)-methyltransferase
VSGKRLKERIVRRGKNVDLDLAPSLVDGLEAYYRELARWNKKINLTAFPLEEDGTDDAVDRLLIEPVLATAYIQGNARSLVDIGSGGGSPAVPMKLARPDLALTMVEVKVRKSVFLRQVSRLLELSKTEVVNLRFEELLARPSLHEAIDVISIRAVKIDASTLTGLQALLKPGGHILNFASAVTIAEPPPPLRVRAVHTLIPENQSRLVVIQKQRVGPRST